MYEYNDLLDEIKEETEVLWNKVLRKYGAHSYLRKWQIYPWIWPAGLCQQGKE